MGKAFEKQINTIEEQGKKQVDTLKVLEPKAIESESNNKPVITQNFYNKILEERTNKILKMSDKVVFNNLIYNFYNFKGPTSSINFGKFGGQMYIYGHKRNDDTTL